MLLTCRKRSCARNDVQPLPFLGAGRFCYFEQVQHRRREPPSSHRQVHVQCAVDRPYFLLAHTHHKLLRYLRPRLRCRILCHQLPAAEPLQDGITSHVLTARVHHHTVVVLLWILPCPVEDEVPAIVGLVRTAAPPRYAVLPLLLRNAVVTIAEEPLVLEVHPQGPQRAQAAVAVVPSQEALLRGPARAHVQRRLPKDDRRRLVGLDVPLLPQGRVHLIEVFPPQADLGRLVLWPADRLGVVEDDYPHKGDDAAGKHGDEGSERQQHLPLPVAFRFLPPLCLGDQPAFDSLYPPARVSQVRRPLELPFHAVYLHS
mmetsp:Transcript_51970/g.161647  ORF Transcript_51970/g.161647 Transcript_51970/m.161647 type:complete len:315 (+) Transcript_51970:2346-3290(+)